MRSNDDWQAAIILQCLIVEGYDRTCSSRVEPRGEETRDIDHELVAARGDAQFYRVRHTHPTRGTLQQVPRGVKAVPYLAPLMVCEP